MGRPGLLGWGSQGNQDDLLQNPRELNLSNQKKTENEIMFEGHQRGFNPYSVNPALAAAIRQERRRSIQHASVGRVPAGQVWHPQHQYTPQYVPQHAQVGRIEIGQLAPQTLGAAAASPVYGGFGAQPGLQPVVEVAPQNLRGTVLGFDATVAASTAATITSRPQEAFRAEKLVVASTIAANFIITDIKVGNMSMLVNSTAVPAEGFTPDAVGIHLRWRTAQPAQDVIIDVTEILGAQTRFLAMMTGSVAE